MIKRIVSTVLIVAAVLATFFAVRALNDPQRGFRNSGKFTMFEITGRVAPPFDAKVLGKDEVFTRDSIDRPTMFVFFGTFCPHCKDQMPVVRDLHNAFGERAHVFAVNGREYANLPDAEREQRVAAYLAENSWSDVPTLIAPVKMQVAFKLEAVPAVVVIGRDRTIRYVGLAGHDRARLESLLDEAM